MAEADLAWGLVKVAANGGVIVSASVANGPEELVVRLRDLVGGEVLTLQSEGVVKAVARLLEICLDAQTDLNSTRQAGDKLRSFRLAGSGTPAGGFVPITYTFTAQYQLTSTPEITGVTGA